MKLSNLGLKTKKCIGSNDCYISELLEQSGQLKKYSAGCFGFGTILLKIKRNIEDIIRKNLDDIGCAEVQYSILQAQNYWEASGRWNKYVESGTMFTTHGKHGNYAISATAEEFSVAMVKDHVKSYRDLGFCHYQIGTKFRDEIRCQGGLIKSKEFNMMDAYSEYISDLIMAIAGILVVFGIVNIPRESENTEEEKKDKNSENEEK